jgi:hypothetical protein
MCSDFTWSFIWVLCVRATFCSLLLLQNTDIKKRHQHRHDDTRLSGLPQKSHTTSSANHNLTHNLHTQIKPALKPTPHRRAPIQATSYPQNLHSSQNDDPRRIHRRANIDHKPATLLLHANHHPPPPPLRRSHPHDRQPPRRHLLLRLHLYLPRILPLTTQPQQHGRISPERRPRPLPGVP